jgi:glycosyltransferase involved in cell wall biosynthesis
LKIIFNSAHQRFGGAIQVALSFIQECRKFPENEYHVWIGLGLRKVINKEEYPSNFIFYEFDIGPVNLLRTLKIQKLLRSYENKIQPDVIFATSGPSYYHSIAPQIIGYNLPLYIYKESPYIRDLRGKLKIRYILKRRLHFYFFRRDANAYVVQTEDVQKRVMAALKTKNVFKVSNTASSLYANFKKFDNKLPAKQGNTIRFITITSYYLHKDLEIIPKVIRALENKGITNVEFVITIKKEDYSKYIEDNDKIINVGPVKPTECPSLYNECDFLFLPTLAECFSASYPEAMIMNKPIITTDLGFARSICKDAAVFYEAKNPISAANQIEKLINNKELQTKLISRGHEVLKTFDTPLQRAEKYLEICKKFSK